MVGLEAALAVCAAFVVGFVAGLELLIYPFAGLLRRTSGRSKDAEAKGAAAVGWRTNVKLEAGVLRVVARSGEGDEERKRSTKTRTSEVKGEVSSGHTCGSDTRRPVKVSWHCVVRRADKFQRRLCETVRCGRGLLAQRAGFSRVGG